MQEIDGQNGDGLMLVGMRERAALVGGSVEFESAPGKGTTVFARVPVEPEPPVTLDVSEEPE